MKYFGKKQTNNNNKHKQTNKQKNRIKNTTATTIITNFHTITSKLFSLVYFAQKLQSGYGSDGIYKRDLYPLLP